MFEILSSYLFSLTLKLHLSFPIISPRQNIPIFHLVHTYLKKSLKRKEQKSRWYPGQARELTLKIIMTQCKTVGQYFFFRIQCVRVNKKTTTNNWMPGYLDDRWKILTELNDIHVRCLNFFFFWGSWVENDNNLFLNQWVCI